MSGRKYLGPISNNSDLINKNYVDPKLTHVGLSAPSDLYEGRLWYDTTNNVLKSYNGSSWDPVVGYTGSQGIIGYTGSRGLTGYTGSRGLTGYTGSFGYTGSQGVIGYTGSQSTVQGPIGYTGSRGLTGYTGSFGYTGSQGIIGYTGSRGVTGYTGSFGFTGSQGIIGYTGSRGLTGYTGSFGFTGSKGDIGYTGSASTVIGYTGSQGYTGSRGYTGSGISGTTNYIPKFNSTTTLLNSVLYETDSKIGLGIITPEQAFDVLGKVKTTEGFETGDFEIVYNGSSGILEFNYIG